MPRWEHSGDIRRDNVLIRALNMESSRAMFNQAREERNPVSRGFWFRMAALKRHGARGEKLRRIRRMCQLGDALQSASARCRYYAEAAEADSLKMMYDWMYWCAQEDIPPEGVALPCMPSKKSDVSANV